MVADSHGWFQCTQRLSHLSIDWAVINTTLIGLGDSQMNQQVTRSCLWDLFDVSHLAFSPANFPLQLQTVISQNTPTLFPHVAMPWVRGAIVWELKVYRKCFNLLKQFSPHCLASHSLYLWRLTVCQPHFGEMPATVPLKTNCNSQPDSVYAPWKRLILEMLKCVSNEPQSTYCIPACTHSNSRKQDWPWKATNWEHVLLHANLWDCGY